MRNRVSPLILLLGIALSVALHAMNAAAEPNYFEEYLVSSAAVYTPLKMDPNLVGAWGLVASRKNSWWVSAEDTREITNCSSDGTINSSVVDIPCVTDFTTAATTPVCPYPAAGGLNEPNNPDIATAWGGADAACSGPKTPASCCTGAATGTCDSAFGGGPTGIVVNPFRKAFEVGISFYQPMMG